jgi:hypothetical protein
MRTLNEIFLQDKDGRERDLFYMMKHEPEIVASNYEFMCQQIDEQVGPEVLRVLEVPRDYQKLSSRLINDRNRASNLLARVLLTAPTIPEGEHDDSDVSVSLSAGLIRDIRRYIRYMGDRDQ